MSQFLPAQEQDQPKRLRFDLTPLLGYRTSITFTGQPGMEGVTLPRVVLEASPSYGFAFGVRLDEEDLIEFRWTRQDTQTHVQGAVVVPSTPQVTLDQFHGDFTHEYILEPWQGRTRVFIMASVGGTHVSGSADTSSFTRFSFGIGGGFKIFPNRHLGFRIQAEWLPVWVNPEVNAFICGAGCVIRLGGTLSSQGDVSLGPELRF
ncbi:MAG TPA: hypothetical protein VEI01_04385 [Terriglobales bacterium]|nr:hypothetical protein [Terriglobales bacterium]